MNAFNRVLVVILLLLAILSCTALLVVPVQVLQAVGVQIGGLVRFLNSLQWYARLSFGILFAITLDIIFILLLVMELRKPKAKAIKVEKVSGGEVMVTIASIADRLKYEIDQLPGVLRTKTNVSARRGGVVVELDVEAAAGINVPDSVTPIVDVVQNVVEVKMGLKIARPPKVHLHTVAYPKAPKTPILAERLADEAAHDDTTGHEDEDQPPALLAA